MARRGRQTGLKSLGPGHRKRNKNPKLSPYQRELKRARLANQAPRPYVNASAAGFGKKKDAAGISPVTPDTVNPALMYQKRDTPAKARGLMQYLQEKEERQAERKRQREEEQKRNEEMEREEEEARLAYRERGEIDDEEEEYEEIEEIEEDEEVDENSDDDLSDDAEGAHDDDDMAALLADLKTSNAASKKAKKTNATGGDDLESDEEIISSDDDDDADEEERDPKMVLTHVPRDPSGKQLKAWMVKKERLSYLEMKEKGDAAGCEALLKKVLIRNGYTFVDPELIKAQRKTRREQAAAEAARRRAEREDEAAAKAENDDDESKKAEESTEGDKKSKKPLGKKKKFKPMLEGELSTQLEDLNEEMLYQHLSPNVAAAMAINSGKAQTAQLDPHAAFAAETAMLNLKLLKKKEKKHLKKSVKRREKTIEEFGEMEQKIVASMSKTQNKKIRKEKALEGDANYRLHQKLANQQIENLKSGLNGPKRARDDDGAHADTHDPNVVLKFQQYENEQNEKKNKIKRLSGMDEKEINRLVEIEDNGGKLVEKIKFGERAEAPPVFSVVPTMSNSFAKFAAKLGVNPDGTPMKSTTSAASNPVTGRNKKINGVAVTSTGGIRAQQNKPGKAMEMKLAAKSMKEAMKRGGSDANIISTAPRTDSTTGEMTLYERKRLAKLGLMGPVTEQRINRSSVANGGEGNVAHNASEMELLRQRVMQTYQNNRKAARKSAGVAPSPAIPSSVSRSWLPTDRDY